MVARLRGPAEFGVYAFCFAINEFINIVGAFSFGMALIQAREARQSDYDTAFAAYAVCCVGALTWPGYAWLGNRIEPYVLGIPFSLAWVVGWVLATFVALVVYHLTGVRREAPEGTRS